jgi:hypothetical protein
MTFRHSGMNATVRSCLNVRIGSSIRVISERAHLTKPVV